MNPRMVLYYKRRGVGKIARSNFLHGFPQKRGLANLNRKEIEAWAESRFEAVVTELGYELVDTEFVQEYGDWYLRFTIDHPEEGITQAVAAYDAQLSAEGGAEEEMGETGSENAVRGIHTGDCQRVSHAINTLLDEDDPIELPYSLEVCSPGLDRVIKKDRDFVRYAGRRVDVKLFKKVNGTKQLSGILVGKADGKLTLTCEEEAVVLDESDVAQVRLAFELQEGKKKKK